MGHIHPPFAPQEGNDFEFLEVISVHYLNPRLCGNVDGSNLTVFLRFVRN